MDIYVLYKRRKEIGKKNEGGERWVTHYYNQ